MCDLVSVIIPSYNRYKWLCDAVESVKKQTYKNIEIIIVNDFSNDKQYYPLKFSGKTNNEFNTVLQIDLNKKNCSRTLFGSPCGAYCRNIGIKNSKGKYICFLDDDDYWLPNKVEIQIDRMKKNNKLFSLTNTFIMHKRIEYNRFNYLDYIENTTNNICYTKDKIINVNLPKVWNNLFFKNNNYGTTSSSMISRKIIDTIGLMTETPNWGIKKGIYQDWDYWKRITRKYDCLYIDTPLIVWYQHKRGLTIKEV